MRCMSLLTPKEKNTAACCARNASAFAKLKILPAATLQCKISYFSILQSDLHLATKSGADCDAAYGPEKQSAHVRRRGAPPCLLVVFPSSASLYLPLAALRLRHPTRNMYHKVLFLVALSQTNPSAPRRRICANGATIHILYQEGASPPSIPPPLKHQS